jgi:hypothetical protein
MKNQLFALGLLVLLSTLNSQLSTARAQGTAFTYQGRLQAGGQPANGLYDFTFQVFDAASAANSQGSLVSTNGVGVTNGLFVITLDFGNQFSGAARWLEISVSTNLANNFFILAPRQQIMPAPYAITAGNVVGLQIQPNTNGAPNVIGGASVNFVSPGTIGATIAGGGDASITYANSIAANFGFIGGGLNNQIQSGAYSSTIGGGLLNQIQTNADHSTIGGGQGNQIQNAAFQSAISGGAYNQIEPNASYSVIGGGQANQIQTNASSSVVSGGEGNHIQPNAGHSVINGGKNNQIAGSGSFIGGGGFDGNNTYGNIVNGNATAIGGGLGNAIINGSDYSTIGGGAYNTVGFQSGIYSSPAFGAVISGGSNNTNQGNYATIPGGDQNVTAGANSFAAGHRAKANHNGCFVWADPIEGDFTSTATNQFLIRAWNGVGININNPTDSALSVGGSIRLNGANLFLKSGTDTNHGLGYYYSPKSFGGNSTLDGPVLFGYGGGILGTKQFGTEHIALQWSPTSVTVNGTFNNNSDRNAKQDFTPLSPSQILDKVLHLPVSEWSYKVDAATRHVGPMAQDFYSVFGIGTDERHIAPIDEGGVALAAIQGLNEKVEAQTAQLQQKDKAIRELGQSVAELKELIAKISQKVNAK